MSDTESKGKFGNIMKKFKKDKVAKVEENKDDEEREEWSSGLDFFLSALGYAVGVGNVWRFPYLCYKNGGGVFLIPYFIFMLIIGIPMVYLEFTVGQFTSCGPLTSWKMVRIVKGIGISVNIANSLLVLFYNMIIAYSLYFLILSLTSELPWQKCNPEWASPNCVDDFSRDNGFRFDRCLSNETFKCAIKGNKNYGRCFNNSDSLTQSLVDFQPTCDSFETNSSIGYWKPSFPSQDFWQKVVLKQSPSIDESGSLVWQLVVALLCAYIIVYLMLVGGKKISGKLVWFTALFPYVVLLILGIRGWMLPGAAEGIKYYIIPDWSKLGSIQVWSDAATQIFFTLAVGYGGMSTLSSYNKFDHNSLRDAIIIPCANCVTSFFAGFVIFAYMGYLSYSTGQDIDDVVQAGQGLAYVVYPYAVTTIAGAPFWAIMFFFMMTLLGIDSTLGCIEVTIATIMDAFPQLESTKLRRFGTFGIVFAIYFLGGLIFTLESGAYWIEIFNTNAGGWAILFIGIAECVAVSYLYGLKNIRVDIGTMLGPKFTGKVFYVWTALWGFITPVVMLVIVIVTFTQIQTQTLGDYVFPPWTLAIGQMMTASVMLGIVLWPIYAILDAKFWKKRSFKSLFTPDFVAFVPAKDENKMASSIARGFTKVDPNHNNENFSFQYETNF